GLLGVVLRPRLPSAICADLVEDGWNVAASEGGVDLVNGCQIGGGAVGTRGCHQSDLREVVRSASSEIGPNERTGHMAYLPFTTSRGHARPQIPRRPRGSG